ncbi:MAG: 3-deoxy-D-manno-octulosonic acid transferase [Gemmataceae bacterium]
MRWLLDAVYLVALVVMSPWLAWRAWRTKRYRQGLRDKLCGFRGEAPPGAVWFHAVSLGEMKVLGQLVPAFRQRHPGRPVVVSSTTDTGLEEARKLFGDLVVFPFPFDFSWAVERTLCKLEPALVVLCESELWPNFVATAKHLGVPVAVVNGRMSPRSLGRYSKLTPLVRGLFARLDVVGVQSEEYAAAMLALGATPGCVRVTGNIKYDGALTDPHNPRSQELRRLFDVRDGDVVWVAGSLQPAEEEVSLGVWEKAKAKYPSLRTFVVPRQRERFDEVARRMEAKRIAFVRRSQMTHPARADVVLLDTIGELGALWALADVAFVGGSLDGQRGGQSMIEPAAFGAAVTFGPHVWNFRETARRLVECGGAFQVNDAAELEATTLRLLGDKAERRAMGEQARRFVLAQQGATRRTLDLLDQALTPPAADRAA